jgi:hypothetical protein
MAMLSEFKDDFADLCRVSRITPQNGGMQRFSRGPVKHKLFKKQLLF